jgi:hypothetical protein
VDLDAEVRRLVDERDEGAVLRRYAQALDSDHRERIPGLFASGGRVSGLGYDGPMEEWLPMFSENMERTAATSVSTHLVGNQLVDVAVAGDEAETESYCIAHQVLDPAGEGTSSRRGLIYREHLVRGDDGAWRIRDRDVDQRWRTKGNPPGSGARTIVPARQEG